MISAFFKHRDNAGDVFLFNNSMSIQKQDCTLYQYHHWVVAFLKYFLECSPRKLGKIPILTSIFFRWVGSTTNYIKPNLKKNLNLCSNTLQLLGAAAYAAGGKANPARRRKLLLYLSDLDGKREWGRRHHGIPKAKGDETKKGRWVEMKVNGWICWIYYIFYVSFFALIFRCDLEASM